MSQTYSYIQRRIFLSVRGGSGKEAAEVLMKQWSSAGYGSEFDFWYYGRDTEQGEEIVDEYIKKIRNCHFYVPVLTADFIDRDSPHIARELNEAIKLERDYKTMLSHYRFILPYLPDNLIDETCLPDAIRNRVRGDATKTAESLHNTIKASEGLEVFRKYPRYLESWPDLVFDENGTPDVMFVLGHTSKEGRLIQERVESFRKWGLLDEDPEGDGVPQSLRPAQMVPALQRYLYNTWLSRQKSTTNAPLPEFPCEIDRHLINYRWESLSKHNLICLGAGDTNWISRALQRYYRGALLGVRFGKPDSSQSIVINKSFVINTRDFEKGKVGKLTLSEIEQEEGHNREIGQFEPKDDLYSALIISLPNPWNVEKSVLICAGLTGLGTLAAMDALMDPHFKEKIKENHLQHVAIIKGKEKDWLPKGYEIVDPLNL